MVTAAANPSTPRGSSSQPAQPQRVRLDDDALDVAIEPTPVRFNGNDYVIPIATTAYGDTLYGAVATIMVGKECDAEHAQQYHKGSVNRFPVLAHNKVDIIDQLQDLKQMSYKYKNTVFTTHAGLKKIFEHAECPSIKKNLTQIMALLKQARKEATATTQATTAGASGKKRAHSGSPGSSGGGSVADMYAAHEGAGGAPARKLARGAIMQELQGMGGHSEAVAACAQHLRACNQEIVAFAGNVKQLQPVAVCTQQLQACNQELVAFAGNAQPVAACTQQLQACNQELVALGQNAQQLQAVVGCTQNIQACTQALAALAERSQEVHGFVRQTLAQKDALAAYRVEFELLGGAIDTTAQAFVRLANGKGLYVDQEARNAAIEAARNEKLIDFHTRMDAFEDRKLERAKEYADLEARKGAAPEAAPAPEPAPAPAPAPEAAPAPEPAPAPAPAPEAAPAPDAAPADAAPADKKDEDSFTVRDVMEKYKLLEGIPKNDQSLLVRDAGGLAYKAHLDADRVFAPSKKYATVTVRTYFAEDVPHVLAACRATIQAYRAAHPADATQRTLDEFLA